jgi:hypothetical protein
MGESEQGFVYAGGGWLVRVGVSFPRGGGGHNRVS